MRILFFAEIYKPFFFIMNSRELGGSRLVTTFEFLEGATFMRDDTYFIGVFLELSLDGF